MTSSIRWMFGGILSFALALGCAAGDSRAAGDTKVASISAALVDRGGVSWAYVVPTVSSYQVSGSNYHNSGTGSITVSKLGTGRIRVTFPGEGNWLYDVKNGNVQVVAVGNNNRRCKVAGWGDGPQTPDAYITIACHSPNGSAADSAFTVLYARETTLTAYGDGIPFAPDGAYLWADSATANGYAPSANYNWSASGGSTTIYRSGTGSYRVVLGGLAASGGSVQVTAYGSGSEYCKVLNWFPSGSDMSIGVNCFDTNGNPADTQYSLAYEHGATALEGGPDGAGAHVWANNTTSLLYSPSATYSYNYYQSAAAGVNTAGKFATGDFFIRNGLFQSGVPHVTAYGSGPNYCKLYGFGYSYVDNNNYYVQVETLCYNASGYLSNSQYVEQLTSDIHG